MRDLILDLLEDTDLDPDRLLAWIERNRGALLLGTALLATLVLLAPGTTACDHPQADLAPDDTPLFV